MSYINITKNVHNDVYPAVCLLCVMKASAGH
jgi:hypothetical protein